MDPLYVWPFELTEKIGEGGMGVVYRGQYVKNKRQVAVKLLPEDVTDETILARFERELDILKSLRHPNIVYCFGGTCGENSQHRQRFYAMELVDGGTLDHILTERGRLPWEQAVEYGLQMCAALAYAHERGVVHRDVKPGNFLITKLGQLKLSDFGLATVAAARKITADGKTMGTYRYMAPEQIRGKLATPKTDLYALGCVLYEMLAGRPPFNAESPAGVLHQHLKEPPGRVTAHALDCPPALEELIGELLEKDPDERPESAAAVAERLQQVAEPPRLDPVERKVQRRRAAATVPARDGAASTQRNGLSPRWLVAAGAVIVLLLLWNLSLSGSMERLDRIENAEAALLEIYRDESDPAAKIVAARALGELQAGSPEVVEALTSGLTNQSNPPAVRAACAEALGKLEADAGSANTTLAKAQKSDPDPHVRAAAGAALASIRQADDG
ncbi:MAG: protein kinase domain-containing protein, partial [Planctomycetaceae bacterium]